ncbi:MAG TPA: sigma-E factor regulatory protein RseB domain-containing protein [Acidobacteriaceae bacterium]|nr:sigma-E factor regulatory protein RseB domain-containing protein [Acidobacteriaceae bacterium]
MKPANLLLIATIALTTPSLLHAAPPAANDLQSVMNQMNASAPKFQDMQADISVDQYTAVVQEHQTQTGTSAFRRVGNSLEMVTHLKGSNGAAASDLLYKNGELDLYQPAAKTETIMSAGANRSEYDSMLATGFGATSKDLESAWNVTFQGMESVGGTQTAKLDLVPKDQNIRNNFSHVIIWVDLSRDISLKQQMVQPTGDSRTVTYSNVRYNKHPSSSLFQLKIPKGTQVTRR